MAEAGESLDVQELLAADTEQRVKAIRGKVGRNEPLTKAEREFLVEHGRAGEPVPPANGDALEPIWAKNQTELAQKLGCSRKQIQRYRRIEGEDAPPAPAADGRENVTLWKLWCQDHGHLRKKLSHAADKQLLEDRKLQLDIDSQEMRNAQTRGELLAVDECVKVITEMFGQIVAPLRGAKHTLGPLVVGTTVPEATKRIGRAIDEQLTTASKVPDWAVKKKGPAGLFWSRVSAELSDLPKRFNLGDGLSAT
jgi:hypothetical protein